MLTTSKKYHYIDLSKERCVHEAVAHHFTPGSESLDNEVCLVNTCGDYTGFEEVPVEVDAWLDKIGIDFTHFPNLSRLWGDTRSEYAFTFRYEIGHERDSVSHRDYPIALSYDEQLKLLMEAAANISRVFPHAIVRLVEKGACSDQHELEIVFLYPCEPKKVIAGAGVLKKQFDYVWDIGRDPGELTNTAQKRISVKINENSGVQPDASQKPLLEVPLPNGMTLTAKELGDTGYPGICIELNSPGRTAEQLCFAEYNPEKPDGKNICICAYAHNIDEPTYYAGYHDNGEPCGVV